MFILDSPLNSCAWLPINIYKLWTDGDETIKLSALLRINQRYFSSRKVSVQWRTDGGCLGCQPLPPPKKNSKALQNHTKLNLTEKTVRFAEFRTPTLQDVRKKGSKILKLPPVRNCFTLAMTDKLVVIINSLKVPKIKKIYDMKWNFLYQITAASRTPD